MRRGYDLLDHSRVSSVRASETSYNYRLTQRVAWISSYKPGYGQISPEQLQLLSPPARAVRPTPNSVPSEPQRRVSRDGFVNFEDPSLGEPREDKSVIPDFFRYGMGSAKGRRWDHLRSTDPVIVSGYTTGSRENPTSWHEFVHSSTWGRSPNEKSQIVDDKTFHDLQPTFDQAVDWNLDPHRFYIKERRSKRFTKRMWDMAMRHSLSPFMFRLTVIITSLLALAIAARIYRLEENLPPNPAEETQSLVALIVDCVSIPYNTYMIWDEYTGKPIGLRSALSKVALVLLDIFFIIFKSASTALAFESLVFHGQLNDSIAQLAKAMASFMLIGLLAWTMNLAVNVFRTVDRLGGIEDDEDGS